MERFVNLVSNHSQRFLFFVLAAGMVAILLIAARDVPLSGGQKLTLLLSTVGLAALSTWIIGWGEEATV